MSSLLTHKGPIGLGSYPMHVWGYTRVELRARLLIRAKVYSTYLYMCAAGIEAFLARNLGYRINTGPLNLFWYFVLALNSQDSAP